jgi:hypothetical protein
LLWYRFCNGSQFYKWCSAFAGFSRYNAPPERVPVGGGPAHKVGEGPVVQHNRMPDLLQDAGTPSGRLDLLCQET